MRWFFLLLCLCSCATNKNVPRVPVVKIVNEANIDASKLEYVKKRILYWTPKVYEYNYANPGPVKCVLSSKHGVGSWYKGTIHVPAFFLADNIVETYIHELGHHATGHRSSMFFKEGIATATLEAVFEKENRIPNTWPQYGQTNDNWVRLFIKKNDMLPLDDIIRWKTYMWGRSGDYRSWQVYVVGGSFVKWYITKYGYEKFQMAFRQKHFHKSHHQLEKEWKGFLSKEECPAFSASEYLPTSQRYDYFINRLKF